MYSVVQNVGIYLVEFYNNVTKNCNYNNFKRQGIFMSEEKTLYEEFKHTLPPNIPAEAINNMPRAIVENLADEYAQMMKDEGKEAIAAETEVVDSIEDLLNEVDLDITDEDEELIEEVLDEEPEVEEVVEEKKPKVKIKALEEKSEVKEQPVEKKSSVPQEINLDNLNIVNVNSMDAINSYNRYIKKKIRSTFFVALPASGYTASMRGLNIEEVDSIRNSFDDNYEAKERIKELAYACIEKSSVNFASYAEFLEGTALMELDILLFGIMVKTFGMVNEFNHTCSSCGTSNSLRVNLNNVVRIDNDTSLKKIEEIQTSNNPREQFNTSIVRALHKVYLPDSKIVLELKVPTLSTEKEKVNFFRKSSKKNSTRLFTYANVIHGMYIPYFDVNDEVMDTPYGFTKVNSMDEIIENINLFSKEDRDVIESALTDFYKFRVDFKLEDVECSKCNHKSTLEFDIQENFILSIYREV